MIKKTVDSSGTVILSDGDKKIASIATELDKEKAAVKLTLEGILRTDMEAYLGTELQFYEAVSLRQIEVDCGGVTAIAPGCFGLLLELKIKTSQSGGKTAFLNKPECIVKKEKDLGKVL